MNERYAICLGGSLDGSRVTLTSPDRIGGLVGLNEFSSGYTLRALANPTASGSPHELRWFYVADDLTREQWQSKIGTAWAYASTVDIN